MRAFALAVLLCGCATLGFGKSGIDGTWVGVRTGYSGGGGAIGEAWECFFREKSRGHLSGSCNVRFVAASGDGRPFMCSKELGFEVRMRFDLEGSMKDGVGRVSATLADLGGDAHCASQDKMPDRFLVEHAGDFVSVSSLRGGRVVLERRVADAAPVRAQRVQIRETSPGDPAGLPTQTF